MLDRLGGSAYRLLVVLALVLGMALGLVVRGTYNAVDFILARIER